MIETVTMVLVRVILIEYEDSKVVYELFCVYCKKYSERIPITFLLGFYVTQVSNSSSYCIK